MAKINYREGVKEALVGHTKIIKLCRSRGPRYIQWCVEDLVEEIRNDRDVIPALRCIQEIVSILPSYRSDLGLFSLGDFGRDVRLDPKYRNEIIDSIHSAHNLTAVVTDNLATYMERAKQSRKQTESPADVLRDGCYSHIQQIEERLNFLTFWLHDGLLDLGASHANVVWKCLYIDAIYPSDKEDCFSWFLKLFGESAGDSGNIGSDILQDFFTENILQMDPGDLTLSGFECFKRFCEAVNIKEKKMILEMDYRMTEDLELIGLDYLWRIIIYSSYEVGWPAVSFLVSFYTNLGTALKPNRASVQDNFVDSCFERLENNYDKIVNSTEKSRVIRQSDEYGAIIGFIWVLYQYFYFYEHHAFPTSIPLANENPIAKQNAIANENRISEVAPSAKESPSERDASCHNNDAKNCSSEYLYKFSRRVSFLEQLGKWINQLGDLAAQRKIEFLLESRVFNPSPQAVLQQQNNLGDDFEKLFLSSASSDIVFVVGEEEIPAHKLVLTTRLPYFEHLFASGSKAGSR